jgi:hypothetical protein
METPAINDSKVGKARSLVDLDFQIWKTWGKKATVVRVAALYPTKSPLAIFFRSLFLSTAEIF